MCMTKEEQLKVELRRLWGFLWNKPEDEAPELEELQKIWGFLEAGDGEAD